jgi:RNA methyltransferase, TrmH family
MLIESTQNPKIKNLLLLQQKQKERRAQNLFVVEGIQENHWATTSGFTAKEFFVYSAIFRNEIKIPPGTSITNITKSVFEKLAYRKTTGGILGLYETTSITLHNLELKKNPLVLILDSIEKPGNLGAILRSAEAAGVDAVFLSNPLIDLYNPNDPV